MKSIVYLTEDNPFDKTLGAAIKSHRTIELLAKIAKVHIIYVSHVRKIIPQILPKNVSSEGVFIPNIDLPIKKRLWWLVKTYLRCTPHHVAAYQSPELAIKIAAAIKKIKPEFLVVSPLRFAPYFPTASNLKLIIEEHNIEWQLLYDFFTISPKVGHWHFLIWLAEAYLVKRIEKQYFKHADLVIAISNNDQKSILRLSDTAKTITVLPNIGPAVHKKTKQSKVFSLLFIGNLNWLPNANALHTFFTENWPEITTRYPKLTLDVIGNLGTHHDFKSMKIFLPNSKKIIFHDKQDSLDAYYQQATAVILPFSIGGGIRIKALEALKYAKAIITSPIGVFGLPEFPEIQNPWIVASTVLEYQSAIEYLSDLKNLKKQQKMAQEYYKKYLQTAIESEKKLLSLLDTL